MQNMTPEQAVDFVKTNTKELPESMQNVITADMLSCIDDRKNDGVEKIRIPGAGLGLLMDALGAKLNLKPEEITLAVEKALGGKISYHTDKAHEGDPLKCAGCGHCAGALQMPDKYLLKPEAVTYLQTHFLPQIDMASHRPEVYDGKHGASAVMIVKGNITMTSTATDMVYVYHPEMHRKAIDQIAKEIAESHKLNSQEISEKIWNASQERLGHTVKHLADGLPMLEVSQSADGQISVSTLN